MICAICGKDCGAREYWMPYMCGRIHGEQLVCHDCYVRKGGI